MRLPQLALLLALSGCAATPKGEHAYELRTNVYELPTELALSLAGREACGAQAAPESLVERASAAADSTPGAEESSRPKIRVREGSTAQIGSMSETDCIQDWTVDAQGKVQAVHVKLPDGLELELRPSLVEAAVVLEFRVKQCCLQQPIREAEVTLSNGEKAKVQLSEVVTQEVKSKATLAQGQCLAVLLPGRVEGKTTLVCVRAERLGEGR